MLTYISTYLDWDHLYMYLYHYVNRLAPPVYVFISLCKQTGTACTCMCLYHYVNRLAPPLLVSVSLCKQTGTTCTCMCLYHYVNRLAPPVHVSVSISPCKQTDTTCKCIYISIQADWHHLYMYLFLYLYANRLTPPVHVSVYLYANRLAPPVHVSVSLHIIPGNTCVLTIHSCLGSRMRWSISNVCPQSGILFLHNHYLQLKNIYVKNFININ